MMEKRVQKWIIFNQHKILAFINDENSLEWNNEREIVDFVELFHPAEDLEYAPFILFRKLVELIGSFSIENEVSYQDFKSKCEYIARFASLGDYVRNVYEDELIDSVNWEFLEMVFNERNKIR